MAKEYVADKTAKLVRAYGTLPIETKNKLVRYETTANGSQLDVKLQMALGEGPLHACRRLTYEGFEIDESNYVFHKGETGETGADSIFPSDVDHPNASFINVKLPTGMSDDNQPDKLVGIFECLEIADYNSSGSQTDFGFSANFARVAVDGMKAICPPIIDHIEWGSFDEYRAWCAETISIVKDDETISVPRFENANLWFVPPTPLGTFMDKIGQLSCTDWQWRKGKLRFMPAVTRSSEFAFDLAQVAPNSFKFLTLSGNSRPNGVRVYWRDIYDEFLRQADPIEIIREDLLAADNGIENFLEIDMGVCRKDEAERCGNYWAKVRCDLLDFYKITGSYKSYPYLPGDLVTLTHNVPNWTNKLSKVVKKEEKATGRDGYPFYLQVQATANPYSDDDFTPLTTRTPVVGPNPYSGPPAIVDLDLTERVKVLDDGTVNVSVYGQLEFGEFGYKQTAQIFWKPPLGTYVQIAERTPDASNLATFEKDGLEVGTHKFKIKTYSSVGKEQSASVVEYSIPCDGKDDAPNPVTSFTLTFDGTRYKAKFTQPFDPDLKGFNVYDNSNVFLFFTTATEFIYTTAIASVTLKIKAVDTSGNESTAVSASASQPVANISKVGVATLDTVRIGITGYARNATHRKIERASNSGFTTGYSATIINFGTTVTTFENVEMLTRTYSDTPETQYVKVSHSLDGTNYTPASNTLAITFENELNNGVPTLQDDTEDIAVLDGKWQLRFKEPLTNNYYVDKLKFKMMKDTPAATIGFYGPTDTVDIELADVSDFDANGGLAHIDTTGEIFSYNALDLVNNKLTGITRGVNGSVAQTFLDTVVYPIHKYEEPGPIYFLEVEQQSFDCQVHYAFRNNKGWSDFTRNGVARGTASGDPPPTRVLPIPPPQDGFEDPTNPANDKDRRERDWIGL